MMNPNSELKKRKRGPREGGPGKGSGEKKKERKKERVKEKKGKERKRKMVSSAREVRVKRAPRVGRHC